MNKFKLWCKNRHDLATLHDVALSEIEDDLLEYFGGIRGLLQLALKSKSNLNYAQLLNLSTILNNKSEEKPIEINGNISHFSINSISENSLSKICQFMSEKDEFHLKCTNRSLFYAQFGIFPFVGANKTLSNAYRSISKYSLYDNDYNYFGFFESLHNSANDNSFVEKCITNILTSNDTESIKKIINAFRKNSPKIKLRLKNTGLLSHLKTLILNTECACASPLVLFALLLSANKRNFYQLFDDELLSRFSTILDANNLNKNNILSVRAVLKIIRVIIETAPQFLCHLIRHKIHEIVLKNVLKWYQSRDQWSCILGLKIIIFCFKNYENNTQTQECLFKMICSLLRSLNAYLNTEWKQHICDGMSVKLDKSSGVHVVQRIITNEAYFDKESKFKQCTQEANDERSFEDQKDESKECEQIWLETMVTKKTYYDRKYQRYTTDLNDRELECVPANDVLLCFELLVHILFNAKVKYKLQNMDLKELGIFSSIKYMYDLLVSSGCAMQSLESRIYDASKNRAHTLLAWLFKLDFTHVWELNIFNAKPANLKALNIDCGEILQIMVRNESDNARLFDYLERLKDFFTTAIIALDNDAMRWRRERGRNNRIYFGKYNNKVTIKLMEFITDKMDINGETVWSKEQLTHLLKILLEPAFAKKRIKRFIALDGHETLIKLVTHLLEIYDSQFVYSMLSFCIDSLTAIIKVCDGNKEYETVSKQCCRCVMQILRHSKLMQHMKCSDGNQRQGLAIAFKETFRNILSIPCSEIVNTVILYLNEKKGSVQDWYHNRSLKWIIRFVEEQKNNRNERDIGALMNIIGYASEDIKHNTNFEECQQIMSLCIASLAEHNIMDTYSRKSRLRGLNLASREKANRFLLDALVFIEKYGQLYGVWNETLEGKLLRICYHKHKFSDGIVEKAKTLLKKCFDIDASAMKNEKYKQRVFDI